MTSYAAAESGDWETVGRRAVAHLLADALADLQREAEHAIDDVRRGESVTSDHVEILRECLDGFERAVEAHLAELAEDTEPWSVDGPAWTDGDRPRFASARPSSLHGHDRRADADAARSARGAGVRAVEPDGRD